MERNNMPNVLEPDDNEDSLNLKKLREEFGSDESPVLDGLAPQHHYTYQEAVRKENVAYLEQMFSLSCDQLNPRLVDELEDEGC
jgi:hypothetical protein